LLSGGVLLAAVVAVLAAVHYDSSPKPRPVEPVKHATNATQQARNLQAWLSANS
jgi:hypothetical protein